MLGRAWVGWSACALASVAAGCAWNFGKAAPCSTWERRLGLALPVAWMGRERESGDGGEGMGVRIQRQCKDVHGAGVAAGCKHGEGYMSGVRFRSGLCTTLSWPEIGRGASP